MAGTIAISDTRVGLPSDVVRFSLNVYQEMKVCGV